MHETMRESKMLEQVRRWRAEAYESVRRQSRDARLRNAHDWAARLGLPIVNEDSESRVSVNPTNDMQRPSP